MKLTVRFALACSLALGSLSLTYAHAEEISGGKGAVFVMTNAAGGNEVIAYDRGEDGTLTQAATYATGGNGSGGTIDPLHSQGSLQLSEDHHLLFAVNAGSGSVSSFAVKGSSLQLIDTEPSGGSFPSALAESRGLLYVLNAGGNGNVSGFRIDDGRLSPIKNASSNLSGDETGPSSLALSPDRRFLVVTERNTNSIDVFRVHENGTLSNITVNPSSGAVPFAAKFAPNGTLIVAEAANSISSYAVLPDGTLQVISASLPTLGMATCWNAIARNGHFVYTDNAGSSSLSGFEIGRFGQLTPIGGTVVATEASGSTNLDMAVSRGGRYLYNLNAGAGSIGVFSIEGDGTLQSLGTTGGLSAAAGLNGIAAY